MTDMLTLQDPSKTTRRLRISFDVQVDIRPLPEETLQTAPDLALFQQALLTDPALYERMLALQALDQLYQHLGRLYPRDKDRGWLPYPFFRLMTCAMSRLSLDQALPFLVDEMLGCSDLYYTLPLAGLCQAHPPADLPAIIDLGSGQALDWQASLPTMLMHQPFYDRYLLIEIQGEKVLVLNLIYYPNPDEIDKNLSQAAQELAELVTFGVEVQRLLVVITNDQPELPADVQDMLQVCCEENFPGLPLDVRILVPAGDTSEGELCTI